ncbi:MAG TPA: ATP-binding protein [Pyrinomonadaceae bacterium]|nr:ATP-binding protein [Pyrinomonadaceae bacterium]
MMNERDEPTGEAETPPRARRRGAPWLFGGLVLLLLSALVVLQVFGLWEMFTPDTASDTLLIYALSTLNFVAFFLFTFIFVRSLLKLRRERRERQLGSKLKTRMIVYFIAVSLLPITAMALFSYIFFNRSLEKWFSSLPQEVVREAKQARDEDARRQVERLREISATVAAALEGEARAQDETRTLDGASPRAEARQPAEAAPPEGAETPAPPLDAQLQARLAPLLSSARLSLLAVVSAGGDVRARVLADEGGALAGDSASMLRQAVEGGDAGTTFEAGGVVFNTAAVRMRDGSILVAARERRVDENLEKLVAGAQTFEDFKRNQRKVRLLGLSTLGLLTLMLLFAATWSAIYLARGIGTPIRALAEAAKEVASGNLDHRVTAIADDELAVLAASFNEMTEQLAENRRRIEGSAAELRDKNLALEERRNYIETVLQTVSTGVISLDEANLVTTINASALSMLRLEQAPPPSTPLSEIVSEQDYFVLERVLWRARLRGRATEQIELARGPGHDATGGANGNGLSEGTAHGERGGNGDGGARGQGGGDLIPVALTATALIPRADEKGRGVVLVIEDLSELLAAQRAAAWSEVARRLAHEIKNPLTPIQLSAERIARNFRRARGTLPTANGGNLHAPEEKANNANGGASTDTILDLPATDGGELLDAAEQTRVARVVEECTATISREVSGLKAMVDEFTRFARLPHARLAPADLNEVVRQAVALYEERLEDVRLDVLLAHSLPGTLLDAEQLRRVFVNLIDNSLESLAEVEGERRITIATGHDPARGLLIAEVADTGHGISRPDFARLFQPYFTTRGRGTGLGLAIVQRIITEHGGRIRAEQNRPRGARMLIELPVADER